MSTIDLRKLEGTLLIDFADALDCFWNAAISEAHNRQAGIDTACIMAAGMNAVARRLREIGEDKVTT